MKILALDTSTEVGSVAVLENEKLLAQHLLRSPMNLLSWLSPAIRQVLQETGLSLEAVTAIACGIGPGSFTGVRLQLATARTLAQVRGIPLFGVSSLEALAYQVLPFHGTILACVDARRGEVFTGFFQAHGNSMKQAEPFTSLLPEAVIEKLSHYPKSWILVGEANPYKSLFLEKVPSLMEASPNAGIIQASSIGALAWQNRFEQSGDPYSVVPLYLRASNAEIEKAGKIQ
jgi:tRNA threonylcarbamoyladenosine biosynthesis protein TsaB